MVDYKLLEISKIGETDNSVAVNIDDKIKLRIGTKYPSDVEPISVPKFLHQAVAKYGNRPALAFQENNSGKWDFITYRQYQEKVLTLAKVFIKLGLEARDSVGILAYNCPEWFYTEMATIHAGGVIAGIYLTSSAEAIHHVLNSSKAKIVVVNDKEQMTKVRSIKNQLPDIKIFIQINGPFDSYFENEPGYYKWSDLEKFDVDNMNEALNQRLNQICVNECCCLIYTSGTVGFPKGAMLSHDGITWSTNRISDATPKLVQGQDIYVCFLPLNHIAAQVYECFMPLIDGGCVYFADKNALKGTLVNTMLKARPTRIFAVPRIWEKIEDYLQSVEKRSSKTFQLLLQWAKNVVLNHNMKIMKREKCNCWKYYFAEKIVRTMKTACGLDRCNWCLTGGAPTNPSTKEYLLSLNIKLFEVYGMTETSSAISMGNENVTDFNASEILQGFTIKINNQNEDGHGEICVKTRSTCMGYLNQLDKTKELIDEDDWIHTGDTGYLDENDYLYVTGRIKELIITSGGENIPHIRIENLIKNELPGISNAILIGDRRKFLTLLLTIKTIINPDTGEPHDDLHPEAIEWINKMDVAHKTLSDILNSGPCPIVMQSIQQGIDKVNQNALSNAQKVQKFAILPHDLSIPTGELGPTLKIRRDIVVNKYQHIIDEFYK